MKPYRQRMLLCTSRQLWRMKPKLDLWMLESNVSADE